MASDPTSLSNEHGVVIARGLKVPARDGTLLSVDIYRPAADGEPLPGPFPAILTRSPYDTRSGKGPSSQAGNGEFFARHGYLYAVQDVRGRFDSEGDFVLLGNDAEDGYDVIEWLAARPYCNGRVGTQGTSLRAWNQNAAALERPPHLCAMWINQGGSNGASSALRHNGAFELRWLSWAVTNAVLSKEALVDNDLQTELIRHAEDLYDWLKRLPWQPGESPLARLPDWEQWAIDLYTHGDYDEFWHDRSRNFERYRDETANVPTMYAGSWYDSYARATIENFRACDERLEHQFLLMGHGTHGGPRFDSRLAGEVDMGVNAPVKGNLAPSRRHLMLRWFDRWLKDVPNNVETQPKVHYFRMGGEGGKTSDGLLHHGGEWRTSTAWPPNEVTLTDCFLCPEGRLRFESAPGEPEAKTSFTFDPADPLPTISANVSSLTENLPPPGRLMRVGDPIALRRNMVLQGAADQVTREGLYCSPPYGDLAARRDVIVFETELLEEAVEITGTPQVDIYLSSDAPDTDLFCMLQDIYPASEDWPNGYRLNICDSIFRVRYREGLDRPKALEPHSITRVRFPLYPTSNLFAPGHRIRLLISSSSFPRFDVNPNTGEPLGQHKSSRVAHNTIHHCPRFASRIILPIKA